MVQPALPVDSIWEDVFDESPFSASYSGPEDDTDYLDSRNSEAESLQTHLLDQISLMRLTDSDTLIAMAILDGLDDEGVLTITLDDVLAAIPPEYEVELDEIEAMLHRIQHLDPIGVAAQDLRECLLIQLRQLPKSTPRNCMRRRQASTPCATRCSSGKTSIDFLSKMPTNLARCSPNIAGST